MKTGGTGFFKNPSGKGTLKISKRTIAVMAAVIFIVTIAVISVGHFMMQQYRNNVENNSASLLKEYSNQVSSSIQESLNNDWNIAGYVKATINVADFTDENAVLQSLQELRDASKVKNINLYLKDGHEIDASGHTVNLPEASKHIYEAEKNGRYMVVVQSDIYFILPVTSDVSIDGSQLVAVSVVVNLNDLVRNMGITSFENSSIVYLTQQNGLIISSNTDENIINIKNQLSDGTIRSLDNNQEQTIDDALAGSENYSFIYTDPEGTEYYLVFEAVQGSTEGDWNLVFEAPVNMVDQSLQSYSSFITRMYAGFATVIALSILLVAMIYFRQRGKNLEEVFTRERMLNLLVANTNYVFAMYKRNAAEPVFVSSNADEVLGNENILMIDSAKSDHLTFKYRTNEADEKLDDLNQIAASWDQKGELMSNPYHLILKGIDKYFSLHLYPVVDPEAELLVMYIDVTEERQKELTLEEALSMADEANKAKTKFLANMSHDIRTPMNAIVNMTEFSLQSMDDKERLKSYLETIKLSSDHLLKLINDVLDMSRIESGRTILEREPFSIKAEIDSVSKIIEPLCSDKHQTYTVDIQTHHEQIYGDSLKLRQILINLLNNAVKFTPENGKVSLRVKEDEAISNNHVSYTFMVIDNGIGMAEKDLSLIFEPFKRIEDSRFFKTEGTGLGLSICKSYVEAMGGRIEAQSRPGAGSTFITVIPFEVLNEKDSSVPANEAEETADFAGKHALLCEDNDINRTIATMMLEKIGFQVTAAKDGKDGFTQFVSSEPGQFDVIFMDVQMPVMNGYEATAAIRTSGHPQAQTIPIIAMTANVFKEDIIRAQNSGMNGHIGKPLDMKDIIQTCAKAMKGKGDES